MLNLTVDFNLSTRQQKKGASVNIIKIESRKNYVSRKSFVRWAKRSKEKLLNIVLRYEMEKVKWKKEEKLFDKNLAEEKSSNSRKK
jgi:hypothetical protein